MSTTLKQSQWLDRAARGIKQACTHCAGRGWIPIFETNGITTSARNDACSFCKGSRIFRSYAETGLAGWLRDRPYKECGVHYQTHSKVWGAECPSCHGSGKRGSEWPAMVWTTDLIGGEPHFLRYQTETWNLPYVHALDLLDAFALLEEVGWCWERHYTVLSGIEYWAYRDGDRTAALCADSLDELLDKIMAEEEKHGAANGS